MVQEAAVRKNETMAWLKKQGLHREQMKLLSDERFFKHSVRDVSSVLLTEGVRNSFTGMMRMM